MMFGYKVKPNFAVENEAAISKPPTVDFGAAPAAGGSLSAPGGIARSGAPAGALVLRAASPRRSVAQVLARPGAAERARHRPDRHADRRAAGGARVESQLADFEQTKGSQIAVLIVPTTAPEDIEQFGIRVADGWKLGPQGRRRRRDPDRRQERRTVRIEVGYGLEGAIPMPHANRIIHEDIAPHVQQRRLLRRDQGGLDA